MIIKSESFSYDTFIYDNNSMDKIPSYKHYWNQYSLQTKLEL